MEKLLQDYGRYLLLEGKLPLLEESKESARRELLFSQRERDLKRLEWEHLKKPSLFLRLLGNAQEKQDLAYRKYQEAQTHMADAKGRAEDAAAVWDSAQRELERLRDVPERYIQAKQMGETAKVPEAILSSLSPAALDAAQSCLAALRNAEAVSRELVQVVPSSREEQKLDHYAQARTAAKRLLWILEQFPEPDSWICAYLRNPDGFLLAAATKYSRRDRLLSAVGQMEKLVNRLK